MLNESVSCALSGFILADAQRLTNDGYGVDVDTELIRHQAVAFVKPWQVAHSKVADGVDVFAMAVLVAVPIRISDAEALIGAAVVILRHLPEMKIHLSLVANATRIPVLPSSLHSRLAQQ